MVEAIYPDAGQWINALEAGERAGMTQRRNTAATQAGGMMSRGDYKGAADAFLSAGDVQSGVAVSKLGEEQQGHAQKLARQTAVQQKLAANDISGAYAAAGADKDLVDALDKVSEHARDTTAQLASALTALKGPDGNWLPPELARQRYAAIKPTLLARGLPPAQLDGFDPTPENLEAVQNQVLGLKEQLTLGRQANVDAETARHNRATEDGYIILPDGSKAIPKHSGAAPAEPTIASVADPHAAIDSLVAATGATVTSGLRSPEHNAEVGGVPNSRHLTDQARDLVPPHGMTLAQLGDQVRQHVPGAKVIVENDHVHVQWGGAPAATAAHPGDPVGTLYGDPKPVQWVSDGKGNLINQVTGDRKVDATAGADAVANPDLVKAIIEGRAPMPTANRAATDPKWQAAMAEAMAQDPTLDGANYGTRVKTRADFATGTAAKAKTALNTALGHAGDLYGQIDDLNNTGIHWLNSAVNKVGAENIDSRRASINTFNLTKEALMHEAMKVFSGSQGSMMEFKQLADTLTVDDGPQAQHAVLKKLIGLLASKMDALGEQYKTGMGTELDQSQIMSPHALQVFAKISGLPGDQVAPGATSKPGQPAAGMLPPQAVAQLKDGHDTTFGNGQVWTLRGGQPVRVK